MNLPRRPGQHKTRPVLLEQRRGFQRTLEVVADGDHAHVEIAHAQRADERFAGGVRNLGAGHEVQRFVDALFVFVDGEHVVIQFAQLSCHAAAETAESYEQYGFHAAHSFQPTATSSEG